MKPKRCKVCATEFQPVRTFQRTCGWECALESVRLQAQKKQRAEDRETKKRLKSRSDWLKEAQVEFNKFIRLRDAHKPCISCGRYHQGQWHAGHYRTVGACPELRFEESNCHRQCAPCNNHKSGNIVEYRINLVGRIGHDRVEWLEGAHELKHYTIDEIKAIKAKYLAKRKALEAKHE